MVLIVILLVALGMLFGYLRGFKRSAVKLACTALSAILAFVLTLVFAKSIVTIDLSSMLSGVEMLDELMEASPALVEIVQSIIVALASPILFWVLFSILKFILSIIGKILVKILKFSKKEPVKQKLWGIPLGAAQALISVMVFLFVICGYFTIVDKTVDRIDNFMQNTENAESVDMEEVSDVIEFIKADPVVNMLCGGESNNFVFEALTKFEVRGEKYSLTKETVAMLDAFSELSPLMSSGSSNVISEDEIAVLESFTEKFGDSVILKTVGSEIVAACGEKWSNNEAFIGVSFSNLNANVSPVMMKTFDIMETATVETIENDMKVFIDMLNIFSKYDVLATSKYNNDNFINTLNSGFTAEIMDVLSSNERFTVLIPEIEKLSINILSSALKSPDVSPEEYDNITGNIADAMNLARAFDDPEEGKRWLKQEMYAAINDGGVEVTDAVAEIAANAIDNAFEDHEGEFTKETIQEYFDEYSLDE